MAIKMLVPVAGNYEEDGKSWAVGVNRVCTQLSDEEEARYIERGYAVKATKEDMAAEKAIADREAKQAKLDAEAVARAEAEIEEKRKAREKRNAENAEKAEKMAADSAEAQEQRDADRRKRLNESVQAENVAEPETESEEDDSE